MKKLLENFNSFLSEEKGDNLKLAIQAIENEGYGYELIRGGNTIRVLDDNREDAMDKMTTMLQPFGFVHNPLIGGSLGRLEIKDRLDGSVFVLFKPKSRTKAASAGIDFEEALAALARSIGLEAEAAGTGPGSDLIISGPRASLKIEVKTALSADFGQFRAQYNTSKGTWEPRATPGYKKNKAIFKPLFDALLLPFLNQNCILPDPDKDSRLRRARENKELIAGIKSSLTTGKLKRQLQSQWFTKRTDYRVEFPFAAIASYYVDKGDEYIQIGRRGLYALTEPAAEQLGVPLFSDSGLTAQLRFRIKPHAGENGIHSFTVAIKVKGSLDPTPKSLLNPADLEEIKNILS